ncbi:hypothetical protein GPA27_27050 [Aromatoleum toluolicum]|uniref:Uncharacterized protein n=1 Tax=Aromatoleum toluolicum TaxID=90060 RepID=A0ABX1NP92_9RHOO|nr:hypothetical protein [Aromatoleum toluolicum]NMG01032.1 hypothetical protein [Aromatoleum toluolicum]
MSRLITAVLASLFVAASAFAQAPAADSMCESKAIDKNGKPLVGAAKSSFMKKCHTDAVNTECSAKALDKNGKPLAGAAKNSFMKKCQADMKAAK